MWIEEWEKWWRERPGVMCPGDLVEVPVWGTLMYTGEEGKELVKTTYAPTLWEVAPAPKFLPRGTRFPLPPPSLLSQYTPVPASLEVEIYPKIWDVESPVRVQLPVLRWTLASR